MHHVGRCTILIIMVELNSALLAAAGGVNTSDKKGMHTPCVGVTQILMFRLC